MGAKSVWDLEAVPDLKHQTWEWMMDGCGLKTGGEPEYLSHLDIATMEETLAGSTFTFQQVLNHPAQLGQAASGQGRVTGEGCHCAKGPCLAGAWGTPGSWVQAQLPSHPCRADTGTARQSQMNRDHL